MQEVLNQPMVWIAAIFGLVAIFAVLKYGDRIKVLMKVKGAEMNVEGANASPKAPPSSTVKGIKSRSGGFNYTDTTGHTSDIQDVETEKDANIIRSHGDNSPSKK